MRTIQEVTTIQFNSDEFKFDRHECPTSNNSHAEGKMEVWARYLKIKPGEIIFKYVRTLGILWFVRAQ